MSAQFFVQEAQSQVARLRHRVRELGFEWPLDQSVDVALLATVFLDCQIIALKELTDRQALHYLAHQCGVNITNVRPQEGSLAAGLYCASNPSRRWVFVEGNDLDSRRRFSIAHEVGHLELEVEHASTASGRTEADIGKSQALMRFARCPTTESGFVGQGSQPEVKRSPRAWSPAQKREFAANHFAAEMLMPVEGVRAIMRNLAPEGVRTTEDLQRIMNAVQQIYGVSREAAKRRLVRDLRVRPILSNPNSDLFA